MMDDDSLVAETAEFLALHPPFDLLPAATLAEIAAAATPETFAAGAEAMKAGERTAFLYVVRRGAFETRSPDGELLARLTAGECFGVRALMRGGLAVNNCRALENSEVRRVPAAVFDALRRNHRSFAYFFAAQGGGSLGNALGDFPADRDRSTGGVAPASRRVADLLVRPPVVVPQDATVQEAARRMTAENVSSILAVDRDGRLTGIVTDKDLRRAAAEGRPYDAPVSSLMTRSPQCATSADYAMDAMLTMSRLNIHHLPVVDDGTLKGCLSTSSVVDLQTGSPLLTARRIHKAETVDAMSAAFRTLPVMVEALAAQNACAGDIGRIVTSLTDAATIRLLKLAEDSLGPAPVPFVWAATGSQARHEQTALSDQDNCLILHDDFNESEHGAHFRALARFVCDGLNACGYVYCPGDMMATTDQWRQPRNVWRKYFSRWIDEPEPKALMLSSVFFDMRPVAGNVALFDELHDMVLEKSRKNRIFQAYMAVNALTHRPPIGFFRNLVLRSGGEHDKTLDLKHNGITPIVDLARVYALSAGVPAVNTFERLEAAQEAKALSREGAADLRDALEFISMTRLKHQAKMIRAGKPADNFLPPEELSSFERAHLKNAFAMVKTMQASLSSACQLGRF